MLVVVVATVLHGVVALAWIAGMRRAAGPMSSNGWADLLAIAVAMPPVAGVARLVGGFGEACGFTIMRIDGWTRAALASAAPVRIALVALLVGTALLFVIQEIPPVIRARQRRGHAAVRRDARLDAALVRVIELYRAREVWLRRGRQPRISLLETGARIAALDGLVEAEVLVSRGLLELLDEEELDATVAHELAHLVRGGNLRLSLLWLLRAFQAASPTALVVWRTYLEAQEEACDALAAFVTHKPEALASALLNAHGSGGSGAPASTTLGRARDEVLRRADNLAIEHRVRRLLDEPPGGRSPVGAKIFATLLLGVLLWSMG